MELHVQIPHGGGIEVTAADVLNWSTIKIRMSGRVVAVVFPFSDATLKGFEKFEIGSIAHSVRLHRC